jgi:hypothetical protein
MGLFAFRRLRDREAASTEAASLSIAEPKLIPTEPDNGNHDNRHAKRGRRKLVPDAG